MTKIYKPERINLSNHPDFDEKWLQDKIAEDSTILGLGDLIVKDKERIQPKAGRLDLLLQDPESNRRYEVEIQLGETDESHIIRTIEYWDIERKRYPQYDHCAVIVAEDITSRFLNVISLFNGIIPIIAIQLRAFKFGDELALISTTVLDEMQLGLVDEEEVSAPADRKYWLQRATEETVGMADSLLSVINEFAPNYKLNYNRHYIGLKKDNRVNNFSVMIPRKNSLYVEIKIPFSQEVQNKIEDAGIDNIGYEKRYGGYFRLRLFKEDLQKNKKLIKELLQLAYENSK